MTQIRSLGRLTLPQLLLCVVSLGGSVEATSNWPQWRGPESKGVSNETDIPTKWSAGTNVLWKTPIPGRSHSSPIVWGKKVFLTTAIEGALVPGAKAVRHLTTDGKVFEHPDAIGADHLQTLKVMCLDLDTGKVLWERTAFEGTPYDNHHRKNAYATPTPVTDGQQVYAYFGSEGIYSYDLDGKLMWTSSVGPVITMGMGVASSPVVYHNLLIIQCDQDNGIASFIAGIHKDTGKRVWTTRRNALESWSSPLLVQTPQRPELIASAREIVVGYDPLTGRELWHTKGPGINPAPSPVPGKGMVYATAGAGEKRAIAIRLGGSGDITDTPYIAWKYDKGTAHVASPIVYGDYIYLITDNGTLSCLDAKTGNVKYVGGRVPIPSNFIASPVAFDGKILISSEDGDSYIIKAGPAYEILTRNSIGEPVLASPAIAHGKLLMRGEKNLYCIGKKLDDPKASQ